MRARCCADWSAASRLAWACRRANSSSCWASSVARRPPSARRAATRSSSAWPKPVAISTPRAAASSVSLSSSVRRSTPGSASSASARGGGQPGMRSATACARASTCSSAAGSAIRMGRSARTTVRLAVTLPRFRTRVAASRSWGSWLSKPGGRRNRSSRPRPLTLRSSQAQARPSVREKPVMEESMRGLLARTRKNTKKARGFCPLAPHQSRSLGTWTHKGLIAVRLISGVRRSGPE